MKKFDTAGLELSDLRTLLAIVELGTVSRAADRLGMTQSALSYRLQGMRQRFGDALFVRVGHRMSPTPLAGQLAEPALQVMRIVETEIGGLTKFDPQATDREFRIGVNEIGAITLVPRLVRELARRAPAARLLPIQVRMDSLSADLESGRMDIAAGHFPQSDTRLFQQALYKREYTCIVRVDHPGVGTSLTLKAFNAAPQVRMTSSPNTMAWADDNLRTRGGPYGLRMNTQHLAAVPFIVAASDFVAIVPLEIYELFRPIARIKRVRLPRTIPKVQICQYWHPKFAGDPAIKFLRELVFEVGREN